MNEQDFSSSNPKIWASSKTLRDISEAYSSVYEKKEYEPSRDQDGDDDNDFADNMIARMVASGMSREEAIKKVKNKDYNEEVEIDEGRGRWGSDMKRNRSAIRSALSGNVWSTHPASGTSSDIRPKQSSRPQSNYRANLSKTDRAELAVTARKERKDGEDFDSEYTPSRKKVEKAIKKLPLITKNPKKLRKQASIGEEVELWVNKLLEEGYDLSEYTWEDMFEIYFDEATAMAKRGHNETEIRNKIAANTKGGESADRANALANKETFGYGNSQARNNYARKQMRDFRKTTSSSPGLHGYAHKSDDPTVKAKQAARGAQRSALTPKEKKMLNREAYEAYEFVASYLLENNFASTVDDANVIINNMSENWFNQIMEDVRGVSYNPNPIGNAIRAGAGLLKNTMNRPSVQGAIKTGSQMLQKSVPSGGYSTREGDGKPRETPLWDGPSKPTPTTPTKPQTKKQPPMRDEPLW